MDLGSEDRRSGDFSHYERGLCCQAHEMQSAAFKEYRHKITGTRGLILKSSKKIVVMF